MDLKYTIDTPENKVFLKNISQNLLAFGRKFPSPGGSSYYLGMMEHRGKTDLVRHGLRAGWRMFIA